MDAVLARQVERWMLFWQNVAEVSDVERALARLRWLEDFAFHCGTAISIEQFRALEIQIAIGEKKLAELIRVPGPKECSEISVSRQRFLAEEIDRGETRQGALIFGDAHTETVTA